MAPPHRPRFSSTGPNEGPNPPLATPGTPRKGSVPAHRREPGVIFLLFTRHRRGPGPGPRPGPVGPLPAAPAPLPAPLNRTLRLFRRDPRLFRFKPRPPPSPYQRRHRGQSFPPIAKPRLRIRSISPAPRLFLLKAPRTKLDSFIFLGGGGERDFPRLKALILYKEVKYRETREEGAGGGGGARKRS